MEHLYFLPAWFVVYGLFLEAVYALVTFLVASYSYKIYKASSQKELEIFSVGFFLITLSYISWFFLNLSAFLTIRDNGVGIIEITTASRLLNLGAYAHIFFFLAGTATLSYVALKVNSPKTFVLLSGVILFSMLLSNNRGILFYALSSFMLLFLSAHYFMEYKKRTNFKLALMMGAFLILSIGTFELILSSVNYMHYVAGHILIFISYLLILGNLISVFKNGQKKK